jgi:hypothetical protein
MTIVDLVFSPPAAMVDPDYLATGKRISPLSSCGRGAGERGF